MAARQAYTGRLFLFKNTMYFLQISVFLLILSLGPQYAFACDLLSAKKGSFGQSDGSSKIDNRRIANIQFRCDKRFRLGLDAGQHYAGVRRLSDGKGHSIPYRLWQDNGANLEWGSKGVAAIAPHPADALSERGGGVLETRPVYGTAIPSGINPPGIYIDVVRVILSHVPFGTSVPLETDLYISLEIVGDCTLNVVGLGDFGEWQVGSSNLIGVPLGAVTVKCNPPGMAYAVGMDAGLNYHGGMRQMQSNGDLVAYTLYADSGRSEPWGDKGLSHYEPGYVESYPAPAQTAVSTGKTQTLFVWGDAMISESPAGNYNDTVNVVIAWP
jgi:spore coat protein U-like protein